MGYVKKNSCSTLSLSASSCLGTSLLFRAGGRERHISLLPLCGDGHAVSLRPDRRAPALRSGHLARVRQKPRAHASLSGHSWPLVVSGQAGATVSATGEEV